MNVVEASAILERLGMHGENGGDIAPCYTERWYVPSYLTRGVNIRDYIAAARALTIGVVMMSVTERNTNCEQFRRAVRRYVPDAVVTPGRSVNHGGYRVWLYTFTGTKQ